MKQATRRRIGALLLAAALLLQAGCDDPSGPGGGDRALPGAYSVVYLGTLGGAQSRAYDVNNHGHVVGRTQTPSGRWRAFIWRDGRMTMLDTLPTPNGTAEAFGLNDQGDVVGTSNGQATVWRGGRIALLATGRESCTARAINESGTIAGGCGVPSPASGAYPSASFVVRNGQVVEIEAVNTRSTSYAVAVNNHDQVVGQTARYLESQSFLYERGALREIEGRAATDINDRGQIVGVAAASGRTLSQGFLRDGSRVNPVHLLSCDTDVCSSRPESINRHGHVVGRILNTREPQTLDGFVWHRGEGGSLSARSGATILWAHAINDAGQIAGLGINPATGNEEAVLLNPVR